MTMYIKLKLELHRLAGGWGLPVPEDGLKPTQAFLVATPLGLIRYDLVLLTLVTADQIILLWSMVHCTQR